MKCILIIILNLSLFFAGIAGSDPAVYKTIFGLTLGNANFPQEHERLSDLVFCELSKAQQEIKDTFPSVFEKCAKYSPKQIKKIQQARAAYAPSKEANFNVFLHWVSDYKTYLDMIKQNLDQTGHLDQDTKSLEHHVRFVRTSLENSKHATITGNYQNMMRLLTGNYDSAQGSKIDATWGPLLSLHRLLSCKLKNNGDEVDAIKAAQAYFKGLETVDASQDIPAKFYAIFKALFFSTTIVKPFIENGETIMQKTVDSLQALAEKDSLLEYAIEFFKVIRESEQKSLADLQNVEDNISKEFNKIHDGSYTVMPSDKRKENIADELADCPETDYCKSAVSLGSKLPLSLHKGISLQHALVSRLYAPVQHILKNDDIMDRHKDIKPLYQIKIDQSIQTILETHLPKKIDWKWSQCPVGLIYSAIQAAEIRGVQNAAYMAVMDKTVSSSDRVSLYQILKSLYDIKKVHMLPENVVVMAGGEALIEPSPFWIHLQSYMTDAKRELFLDNYHMRNSGSVALHDMYRQTLGYHQYFMTIPNNSGAMRYLSNLKINVERQMEVCRACIQKLGTKSSDNLLFASFQDVIACLKDFEKSMEGVLDDPLKENLPEGAYIAIAAMNPKRSSRLRISPIIPLLSLAEDPNTYAGILGSVRGNEINERANIYSEQMKRYQIANCLIDLDECDTHEKSAYGLIFRDLCPDVDVRQIAKIMEPAPFWKDKPASYDEYFLECFVSKSLHEPVEKLKLTHKEVLDLVKPSASSTQDHKVLLEEWETHFANCNQIIQRNPPYPHDPQKILFKVNPLGALLRMQMYIKNQDMDNAVLYYDTELKLKHDYSNVLTKLFFAIAFLYNANDRHQTAEYWKSIIDQTSSQLVYTSDKDLAAFYSNYLRVIKDGEDKILSRLQGHHASRQAAEELIDARSNKLTTRGLDVFQIGSLQLIPEPVDRVKSALNRLSNVIEAKKHVSMWQISQTGHYSNMDIRANAARLLQAHVAVDQQWLDTFSKYIEVPKGPKGLLPEACPVITFAPINYLEVIRLACNAAIKILTTCSACDSSTKVTAHQILLHLQKVYYGQSQVTEEQLPWVMIQPLQDPIYPAALIKSLEALSVKSGPPEIHLANAFNSKHEFKGLKSLYVNSIHAIKRIDHVNDGGNLKNNVQNFKTENDKFLLELKTCIDKCKQPFDDKAVQFGFAQGQLCFAQYDSAFFAMLAKVGWKELADVGKGYLKSVNIENYSDDDLIVVEPEKTKPPLKPPLPKPGSTQPASTQPDLKGPNSKKPSPNTLAPGTFAETSEPEEVPIDKSDDRDNVVSAPPLNTTSGFTKIVGSPYFITTVVIGILLAVGLIFFHQLRTQSAQNALL